MAKAAVKQAEIMNDDEKVQFIYHIVYLQAAVKQAEI